MPSHCDLSGFCVHIALEPGHIEGVRAKIAELAREAAVAAAAIFATEEFPQGRYDVRNFGDSLCQLFRSAFDSFEFSIRFRPSDRGESACCKLEQLIKDASHTASS